MTITPEMYNYSVMENVSDTDVENMLIILVECGYIDPDNLRNFRIIKEYREMIRGAEKISCKEARERLADKYFISDRTIQTIVYDEKKRKTMYDLNLNRG